MDVTPQLPYEVRQAGERTLWDEVQDAYRWWIDTGKPAVGAWQFTVSSTSQRIELAGSQDQGPVGARPMPPSGEI